MSNMKLSPTSEYSALPSAPTGHGFLATQQGQTSGAQARGVDAFFVTGGKAPIDSGFPNSEDFDRGSIIWREGVQDATLDLGALQGELSFPRKALGVASSVLLAGTGVGLFYLAGKLTLVRQGEVAVAESIDGSLRVLDCGVHLIETVGTTVVKARLSDDFIKHSSLSIVRVNPGFVGLGLQNGRPLILMPGRHLIVDPLFTYVRQEPLTTPHIEVGTIHLITVPNGSVGLATVQNTAHFLEPGRHAINNATLQFKCFRQSTDEHISIGSKHRITVPAGRVGLAFERGSPLLLESGQSFNIDSPYFEYKGSRSLSESVIQHGSLTIVQVRAGSVGITFEDGVLVILHAGRHTLTKASHVFAGFLGLSHVTLQIKEVSSITSDNLGIRFDAAITVRIVDPLRAVAMLCPTGEDMQSSFSAKGLFKTIVDKATLSLSIIIGNSRLNRVFKATTRAVAAPTPFETDALLDAQPTLPPGGRPPYGKVVEEGDPEENGSSSFKQNVHDVFMNRFSEGLRDQCGVHVEDMAVEDFTIIDPELAQAMAQGAIARTNLIKAQIDQDVARAKATAEQTAEVIRAEGRARATAIIAAAEADRIRKIDEAMRSVSSITAQRELIKASGEVLSEAKSSVILAQSIADVSQLLGNGNGFVSKALQAGARE